MANSRKVIAIVQARLGSIRLPNKVMKPILGRPMIGLLLKRLSRCKNIDQIVLATSNSEEDKSLIDYVESIGFDYGLGSENNVLDRYVNAARKFDGEIVVRITGDCPFVDPELVDKLIEFFEESKVDYVSNILPPTYPDGMDVEVFSEEALRKSEALCTNTEEREHVTSFIINNPDFSKKNFENDKDYS